MFFNQDAQLDTEYAVLVFDRLLIEQANDMAIA